MVGDGHVEDELRPFAFIHDLKDFVVGRSVRHHVAEIFGAIEARDVEKFVEPELLVDAIAAPVLRIGGVDGARGIADRFQIRCQVVNAFEVIEHIGVHARPQKTHARSREELELAVARAAAHRRHIDIARGNGSRVRREGNGAVVAFRQLRIRRNVGIRFVHDGDDGGAHVGVGGFGGAYHAGVVDEFVDGFRHGLLAAKLGGARFGIAFGLVRRDFLGTLREAQQRPLRLVRIEAAPHVDVDVQVVFDVDCREADAARGKGCGAKGGVRDGGFPRVLGRRHNRNCLECGEHHGDAECERVVDGVFIAAAYRRCGVNGEHVGRQNGLAFELCDEMVGHAAYEACRKKRDHGAFRALAQEVHHGEYERQNHEAQNHPLSSHLVQYGVVGCLHEPEAYGHACDGHNGARAVEHACEPLAQLRAKRQGEREQGCAREEKARDGQ